MPKAKLALESGVVFVGDAFGAVGESQGEVVFNTSMTGYQEILTDPSYAGQIVTMTYPQIGNTGVNHEDEESSRPWLRGFVVRELSRRASSFRQQLRLEEYLAQHGILGIQGIDTRSLVLGIRRQGALRGVLSTVDLDDASLIAKARSGPSMAGQALARDVMPLGVREWTQRNGEAWSFIRPGAESGNRPFRVVALDFGMKANIGRCLVESGCSVLVMPGRTPAREILAQQPEGIFVSNGPGDPEPLAEEVANLRLLIGTAPIFGICLGHQLLGLAFGAKTYKLKFGHRGANQPVLDQQTGRVEITTQNHGFAVDANTLPAEVESTHINLNDQTLEGLCHRTLPVFSVQYHPEASAGPHDSGYLFAKFTRWMAEARAKPAPARGRPASRANCPSGD